MKKYDGVGAGQKKIRFKKVKVVCGNISMDFIQKVDKTNKKSENHYGICLSLKDAATNFTK